MSAKICKFSCGAMLTWDNASKSFKEQDGMPLNKERCESLKKASKSSSPNIDPEQNSTSNNHTQNSEAGMNDHTSELVLAIRELTAAMREEVRWKIVLSRNFSQRMSY